MRRNASSFKFCFAGLLVSLAGLLVSSAFGQSSDLSFRVANMSEDVRLLDESVRTLRAQVEELRRENSQLIRRVQAAEGSVDSQSAQFVTTTRLSGELSSVIDQLESRDEKVRNEILTAVNELLQKSMKDINKTIASGSAQSSSPKMMEFNDDYPKNGISYTVQSGDTLSSIAVKHKSTVSWIQNANKIVDARLVQVGQPLFIPLETN